ncbi:HAD family hydrolase, partial [Candidatus Falkowbacteria bacterium]|nr:HAD family hydrolase [Candidatus Falkowbacteria bacterium]
DAVTLTVTYPNVRETLDRLAALGHPLAICTNKPLAPTRAVLAHLGLLPLFQVVLGGDSLPVRKPDPAPLFRVLADLGAPRAVYVGDSEVDAATAQAAAMPFALFTEGYRKTPVEALPHDVAFSDFTDLPAIVERLA